MSVCHENFRDIPEYEAHYSIGICGCIYSKSRRKLMKPQLRGGYAIIKFHDRKWKSVHRLVLLAYLGDSKEEVNHKDFNKLNNHLNNLEYVTKAQNMHHAKLAGRFYSNPLYK